MNTMQTLSMGKSNNPWAQVMKRKDKKTGGFTETDYDWLAAKVLQMGKQISNKIPIQNQLLFLQHSDDFHWYFLLYYRKGRR